MKKLIDMKKKKLIDMKKLVESLREGVVTTKTLQAAAGYIRIVRESGNSEVMKMAESQFVSPLRVVFFDEIEKGTLSKEKLKLLLHCGIDLSQASPHGYTPLMLAVEKGHQDIVEILLDAGANLKQTDKEGNTPLIFAVKEGHKDMVEILLDAGADLDQANDRSGETPLEWATKKGHKDIVRLLKHKISEKESPVLIRQILDAEKEKTPPGEPSLIELLYGAFGEKPKSPKLTKLIYHTFKARAATTGKFEEAIKPFKAYMASCCKKEGNVMTLLGLFK